MESVRKLHRDAVRLETVKQSYRFSIAPTTKETNTAEQTAGQPTDGNLSEDSNENEANNEVGDEKATDDERTSNLAEHKVVSRLQLFFTLLQNLIEEYEV